MGVGLVYAAFCDGCEETFEDGFDSHWESRGDLEANLQRSDWKFCEGELLCPTCCDDAEAMGESEEGDDVEDAEDEGTVHNENKD